MRLEGIHHITAITGDAPGNVDFYTRVLGLRLVKKSVNQDDPTVYHLFYADEHGSAGSDLTFFEYPGARRGRAGRGMVHRIAWRAASEDALSFWAERLAGEGVQVGRPGPGLLRFADPEGLEHELAVDASGDEPLIAEHPEVPAEHALRGFAGVRAYAHDPEQSRPLLEQALAFEPSGDGWEVRGERRGGTYAYDPPPDQSGIQGAGTVHHIAWATPPAEQEAWRDAVLQRRRAPDAGDRPLLLQVRLLPRAERRAVRDRHDRPGLHDRRAGRVARPEAGAAARLRAPARADRGDRDAAAADALISV